MSPDIKLLVHEGGCGGIAVNVPSGSVYGGSVTFCIKCMEDEIEKLKNENHRLRDVLQATEQSLRLSGT